MFPRFGSRFEPEGRGFEALPACHSCPQCSAIQERRQAKTTLVDSTRVIYGFTARNAPERIHSTNLREAKWREAFHKQVAPRDSESARWC